MSRMKLKFQKWDIAAIGAVVLLAMLVFALFLPQGDPSAAYAEIYQNGKLVRRVSLTEDCEFTVAGEYSNTVAVKDGKIAVIASDCPGEDCVHCGWAAESGRSIVCLPNGLEIRILSASDDVDFVVG